MWQYGFLFYILSFSYFLTHADIEPKAVSQETHEQHKYLDPGIGVQENYINDQLSFEFCKYVLDNAPEEVKDKVALLTNPFCPASLKPKRIILVGPSGSGKTTLAQVIGRMSGKSVIFINAGLLGNEYKNSAAQNLRRALEPYLCMPCIVILDEIDCLIKQSSDEKNPDLDLPKQVWAILDICTQFPDVTIIGITNDISGMPEPIKTRFAGDIVEIPMLDSHEKRKASIKLYLSAYQYAFGEKEFDIIVKKTEELSHREIEKLVREALTSAFLRDEFIPIIKIEDFEKAMKKIQKNRALLNKINWKAYEKYFQYGIQITGIIITAIGIGISTYLACRSHELAETSFEFTKTHAVETINLQKYQFVEGQKLTKEIADRADKRTVQGMFMQKIQGVMHTFWQHNKDGEGYLALDYETVVDPENPNSWFGKRQLTPASEAAQKYYREGWNALKVWGQEDFNKLVDKELQMT